MTGGAQHTVVPFVVAAIEFRRRLGYLLERPLTRSAEAVFQTSCASPFKSGLLQYNRIGGTNIARIVEATKPQLIFSARALWEDLFHQQLELLLRMVKAARDLTSTQVQFRCNLPDLALFDKAHVQNSKGRLRHLPLQHR